MPTILLKKSDTPGSVPGTANLTNLAGGVEVAVNTADKRVYSMTSASAVIELGTNPSSLTCSDVSATVLRSASATITNLIATSASITTLTNNPTFSAGTANGVLYLNGSKVATSGSALTFDGSSFLVGATSAAAGKMVVKDTASSNTLWLIGRTSDGASSISFRNAADSAYNARLEGVSNQLLFEVGGSEGMRLTSTGLGIGTASPGYRLQVDGASTAGFVTPIVAKNPSTNAASAAKIGFDGGGTIWGEIGVSYNTNDPYMAFFVRANSEKMRLTDAGNLGLGVTPSGWSGNYKTIQNFGAGMTSQAGSENYLTANAYFDGSWKRIYASFASRYEQVNSVHAWYIAGSSTAGSTISFTQAMTLDASGRLGIGSTSPSYKLVLREAGATSVYAQFLNNSDSNIGYIGMTSGGDYSLQTNNAMAFVTGASYTERGRFTAGGYFKASNTGGYDSATGTYHELLNNDADDYILVATHFGATNPQGFAIQFTAASPDNNTQVFLRCADNTTARCIIYSDGDLANHDGVYGTISDERLKQDIVDAGSQWDDLKAIRFRKYRMKTDVEANPDAPAMFGVVAQELAQVCPGLVDEHPNMKTVEVTDEEGNVTKTQEPDGTTTMTVKSSILLMKAAKALQEAMARIEQLEADMAALKGAK